MIVLAPGCLWLWERLGWWSVIGGIAVAGVVDLISITTSTAPLGYPSYLLVRASFHQFGFAWLNGRLAGRARRLALVVIGAARLVLLIEPWLTRALCRPRLWLVTVLVNQRIMTWLLGPLTAVVGLASALLAVGGFGLHLRPLTATWWQPDRSGGRRCLRRRRCWW